MTPPSSQTPSFSQHLCARIFERNDFGSVEELVAAIKTAAAISPETNWRGRKHAFNEIAEKAPMRSDSGYLLKYDEIPAFLKNETKAFESAYGNRSRSDGLTLQAIYISADDRVGISSITRANGVLNNPSSDWGDNYPDMETQSVVLLLHAAEGQLIDRAMIDGETWRTIEDDGNTEPFFEAILDNASIQEALGAIRAQKPSA